MQNGQHKQNFIERRKEKKDKKVEDDVNEDEIAYAKERENQRIESHLYPSEGFNQ